MIKDAAAVKFFSATEVNKFCYCKAQWYYERIYGAKQLNEWRRERNEEMGWEPSGVEDAFARGRRFHEGYTSRYRAKMILRWALAAVGIAAAAAAVWMTVK